MDRCEQAGPYQPLLVRQAAQLALAVAARVPLTSVPGPADLANARALAGAALAEALLRLGSLRPCELAVEEAEEAAGLGGRSPGVVARVTMVRGLLCRARHHLHSAADCFGTAATLFRAASQPALEGTALLRQGLVLAQLNSADKARAALEKGLKLPQDPRYRTLFRNGAEAYARVLAAEEPE